MPNVASSARKMTPELIDYIISYYFHLLSNKEKAAYKHHNTLLKHGDSGSRVKDAMMKHWGTDDKKTLMLLENGYDNFKRTVAERILKECSNAIVINICPNCGKLARTPQAKQCRYCGCNWHEKRIE